MIGLGLGLNKYRKVGGAFTPLNLNPTAWYIFDSEFVEDTSAGSISNNEEVGSVLDNSGNGYTLTKAAAATAGPLWTESSINGIPGLSFNGSSKALFNVSISLTQAYTIAIVFKHNSAAGTAFLYDSISGNRSTFFMSSNTNKIFSATTLNGPATDTDPHYYINTYNATSSSIEPDGDSIINGNAGTFSMGNLIIGASSSTSNFYNGVIAEMVVIDGVLDSGDADKLKAYFSDKFGL